MIKKILAGLLTVAGAFTLFASIASADVMENAYLTMSNSVESATGVSYTFRFAHLSSTAASFDFRFCREQSGTTCTHPASTVDSATLSSLTAPSGEDENDYDAASFLTDTVTIDRTAGADNSADGNWIIQLGNVDNAAITDCNGAPNDSGLAAPSTATCYVRINSYQDTAQSTAADNTVVSYTVTRAVTVSATVDPSFTMIISGIDPSTTTSANGTPLNSDLVTTTVTSIPFGNLSPGDEKFAAQKIVVTTNVNLGYSVTAAMSANMQGNAYGDAISPFAASGAVANTTSAAWTLPTGTVSGTNTGWLGIGTNDTQVTGRGNNQFFPLGTTAQTVANQSTSAQSEENLVTFGIEVNSYQQADSYSGTLRYNALPVY